MRRVVGAIALLLLLAFLVLFIPFPSGIPPSPAQANASAGAQAQILIRSSEIADAGEGKVALMRLRVFSDSPCNLTAYCSPLPPQNNVLILDFPQVPGAEPGLPAMAAAALSKSGISSRMAGMEEALGSQNALIISTSGAIPLPLLEAAGRLSSANSRLVALVSLPGKTIDNERRIAPINGSLPQNFQAVPLPGSGLQTALSEMVTYAVLLPGAAQAHAVASGNFTIAIPINSSSAYCRTVADAGGGKYRFADSGLLHAAPGSLYGPLRIPAGKQETFEFSLSGNDEVGRALSFFAVSQSSSGEEARQEIAGGNISQGWASRFAFSFAHGGKYSLRVLDQFGRVHASAFVSVPALQVRPVSADGNRYEFLALLDGEPANGAIQARLDNGTPKNYSVQDGKLVIWAAPAPGSHTLRLDLSGTPAEHEFVAQQSGVQALLDAYLRFGAPAAIFLLAVFLLLRAGRRARYSITFPEAAPSASEIAEVTRSEVLAAYARADKKFGGFSLPCYPNEIAAQLGKKRIDPQSVLRVLRKLAQQGAFSEHEGAFVPTGAMGGFSASQLVALRTIHECMLERGLRFSRQPVITVKKGELELALFRGKRSVLDGIGKPCRAVVFENPQQQRKFEEELAMPDAEGNRIRLALSNDKIILITASRQALEGALP